MQTLLTQVSRHRGLAGPRHAPFYPDRSTLRNAGRGRGFTLVEMLVVMGIIVVLSALAVPAFNALKGSNDVTTASYTISGTLDQARAYAMSNNTYVFVGIEEVDAGQSSSNVPQNPATATAGGRVVIAVVASKDGTKQYATTTSNQGADWQANYVATTQPAYKGGQLVALSKLLTLDGLHITSSLTPPPAGSGMYRPPPDSTDISYDVGSPSCKACVPFSWPLGSALTMGQYDFATVIQFDPQGVARIPSAGNGSQMVQWIEIALLPAHGNTVPPNPTTPGLGNQVAIQINGMTGATKIYRP